MEGLKARMGQIHKPNLAMSTKLMVKVLESIEQRLNTTENLEDQHCWMSFLVYATITYVLSLRGPEGFLLDLKGLHKHRFRSEGVVVIALLGRLKGERNDLSHLIPCTKITESGINVEYTIHRLLSLKQAAGFNRGPAISTVDGKLLTSKSIDEMLHEVLTEIYNSDSSLFPLVIDDPEKIPANYQCFRTFRRSSATRATEKGINPVFVNVVNRWKTEDDKGKKVSSMHRHYTQFELLIEPFMDYTLKM